MSRLDALDTRGLNATARLRVAAKTNLDGRERGLEGARDPAAVLVARLDGFGHEGRGGGGGSGGQAMEQAFRLGDEKATRSNAEMDRDIGLDPGYDR